MEDLVFSLLTLVMQWFRPRYNAHLQLLQAQIRILRSRIDVSRIVPTPKEKAELLRLGALVDHDVAEVMHVASPDCSQLLASLGIPTRRDVFGLS
jgi:putative transposase